MFVCGGDLFARAGLGARHYARSSVCCPRFQGCKKIAEFAANRARPPALETVGRIGTLRDLLKSSKTSGAMSSLRGARGGVCVGVFVCLCMCMFVGAFMSVWVSG